MDPKNQYKHQGKLLQEELGMQLYDFHARQYDPQIGRFWSIDPLDEFASGYTGMGNNPANLTDPTGMRTQTYNGEEGTRIPHCIQIAFSGPGLFLLLHLRKMENFNAMIG
ncbi:MAG TPA: RHS repeat-associated core domain-containing protein [Flavipsychrobacter sp.]|nr:RHS repeat-associated core domain-containing protein [Flavipsychrobacter sp.]